MPDKTPKQFAVDFIAGGVAGMFEALICHPLDTIKVRMQLKGQNDLRKVELAKQRGLPPPELAPRLGFLKTGVNIVKNEKPSALYKGLGAVITGITPKMAIRFTSYETYRNWLTPNDGTPITTLNTFIAGVGAGITEAVVVVNPMEVVKIRLQAQRHSMSDPLSVPKYTNGVQCVYTVIREEGFGALYRGVSLTAIRQASNQGVNFTVYSSLKAKLQEYQGVTMLPSWQTSIIGLISGALGPMSNAPIDTIKTRMQRESGVSSESGFARFVRISTQMLKNEGPSSLYRGITPRIMRVAPGQAVTFTVYEFMRGKLNQLSVFQEQKLK